MNQSYIMVMLMHLCLYNSIEMLLYYGYVPAITIIGLRRIFESTNMWISSKESNCRPLLLDTGEAISTILTHSSSQFWETKQIANIHELYPCHIQKTKLWFFAWQFCMFVVKVEVLTKVLYLRPVWVNSCECRSSVWKRVLKLLVSVSFSTA